MYAVCSDTCMFICTLYILSQHFHSDPRSPKTRRFLAFQHGWPSTLAVMKHLEASDWAQGPSRYALSNIDWDQGVETDGKLMGIDEHIRKRVSLPLKQVWFRANVIILCPFLLTLTCPCTCKHLESWVLLPRGKFYPIAQIVIHVCFQQQRHLGVPCVSPAELPQNGRMHSICRIKKNMSGGLRQNMSPQQHRLAVGVWETNPGQAPTNDMFISWKFGPGACPKTPHIYIYTLTYLRISSDILRKWICPADCFLACL